MNQPRPYRRALTFLLLPALLLPALLLPAACAGPGYYAQAVSGHLSLMRGRQEIAEILAADDTDPQLVHQLELARQLRQFASAQLGLPDNGSYTRFVRTGREAVTWNIVATPELSLEPHRWCFLVAGFDVAISPTVAYSTLGWFEDPLLDTMLRYREEQLAAVIFHELAHQQLYLQGDTFFNESYASFVEEIGVAMWLRSAGREDRLAEWQEQQRASAQFDALLLRVRTTLAELYAGHAEDERKRQTKSEIFDQLQHDYRSMVRESWQGRDLFGGWFSSTPNNARLSVSPSSARQPCCQAR